MALILILDLDMVKMYLHTKYSFTQSACDCDFELCQNGFNSKSMKCITWCDLDNWCSQMRLLQSMFTDPVVVNGPCAHSVQQISAKPVVIVNVAVTDAPCEGALKMKFLCEAV